MMEVLAANPKEKASIVPTLPIHVVIGYMFWKYFTNALDDLSR